MKRTLFFLFILALMIAVLAGGAAFLVRQNQLRDLQLVASQAEDKLANRKYDEAITLLQQVEAKGGTAKGNFLLGKAHFEKGVPEKAIPFFEELIQKYPKSEYVPDAYLYQAKYKLDKAKDPSGATALLLPILSQYPRSSANDFALVELAKISLKENDEAQGKKNLDIVLKKPNSPARSEAEYLAGDMNMKALKSPDVTAGGTVYTIQQGDNMTKIERLFKVPMDLICAINDVEPTKLTIGRQIKIPDLNVSILIDKEERSLTLKNKGQFLKKYHIAVNQDDSVIPAGEYTVTRKLPKGFDAVDPATNRTLKPGEPGNMYGSRFIELRRNVGIHGTDQPEKIGQYISRGVISMTNEDAEELYGLVQIKPPTTVLVKGKVKL